MGKMKELAQNIDLDDYRRDHVDKLDPVVTSVTLDRSQKEFLDRENLNLSKLVRDFIDQLQSRRYTDDGT